MNTHHLTGNCCPACESAEAWQRHSFWRKKCQFSQALRDRLPARTYQPKSEAAVSGVCAPQELHSFKISLPGKGNQQGEGFVPKPWAWSPCKLHEPGSERAPACKTLQNSQFCWASDSCHLPPSSGTPHLLEMSLGLAPAPHSLWKPRPATQGHECWAGAWHELAAVAWRAVFATQ